MENTKPKPEEPEVIVENYENVSEKKEPVGLIEKFKSLDPNKRLYILTGGVLAIALLFLLLLNFFVLNPPESKSEDTKTETTITPTKEEEEEEETPTPTKRVQNNYIPQKTATTAPTAVPTKKPDPTSAPTSQPTSAPTATSAPTSAPTTEPNPTVAP